MTTTAPSNQISAESPLEERPMNGPPRFILPLDSSSKDCETALKYIFRDGESYPERRPPHAMFTGVTGPSHGNIHVNLRNNDDSKFTIGIGRDLAPSREYWVGPRGVSRDLERETREMDADDAKLKAMQEKRKELLLNVLPEGSYTVTDHGSIEVEREALVRGINALAEQHSSYLGDMYGPDTKFSWVNSEEQRRQEAAGTLKPLNSHW